MNAFDKNELLIQDCLLGHKRNAPSARISAPDDIVSAFAGQRSSPRFALPEYQILYEFLKNLAVFRRNSLQVACHNHVVHSMLRYIFGNAMEMHLKTLNRILARNDPRHRPLTFLSAARQDGKTYGGAMLVAAALVSIPKIQIIACSQNIVASGELIEYTKRFLTAYFPNEASKCRMLDERIVYTKHGSDVRTLIRGKTETRYLRGLHANLIIFDEVAMSRPDYWNRGLVGILTPKASVGWLMSTHNTMQKHAGKAGTLGGWFRDAMKAHVEIGGVHMPKHNVVESTSVCKECVKDGKYDICKCFKVFTTKKDPLDKDVILQSTVARAAMQEELLGVSSTTAASIDRAWIDKAFAPDARCTPISTPDIITVAIDPSGGAEGQYTGVVVGYEDRASFEPPPPESAIKIYTRMYILGIYENPQSSLDSYLTEIVPFIHKCVMRCNPRAAVHFIIEEQFNVPELLRRIILNTNKFPRTRFLKRVNGRGRDGMWGLTCDRARKQMQYDHMYTRFKRGMISLDSRAIIKDTPGITRGEHQTLLRFKEMLEDFDPHLLTGKYGQHACDDVVMALQMLLGWSNSKHFY